MVFIHTYPNIIHTTADHALSRPVMDSKTVIRRMEGDGWYEVSQKGSHKQFKHPTKPGKATVPHPKKDIPLNTLKSIERQTGLKLR
jgi:predicted RNA binding protein YcfA (HicA-like mRNA interferase family)